MQAQLAELEEEMDRKIDAEISRIKTIVAQAPAQPTMMKSLNAQSSNWK